MFHRVTLRAAERGASERFYATVLDPLGIEQTRGDDERAEWGQLALAAADADHPPTRRLHIGFAAPSRALVDAFWCAGTGAGYRDDGPPGPRPQYREDYYGAFLLDPDGNSAEAVVHGASGGPGIDHLWLRVADVSAARRFYETIAPYAGFEVRMRGEDRVFCTAPDGSFSLVAGSRPTEHVHMAFAAPRDGSFLDPGGNEVELVPTGPPKP